MEPGEGKEELRARQACGVLVPFVECAEVGPA